MKRRWLAIALVGWVNVLALLTFLFVPSVAEAAVNCKLATANTITCTGDFSGTLTWNAQQKSYWTTNGICGPSTKNPTPRTPNVELTSKNADGSYAATFNDGCGGSPQTITVANPNNVNPTGAPAGGGNNGGGSGNGTGSDTDPTTLCDAGVLTWLNCAIMSGAIRLVDGIRDAIIAPFLKVQPLATNLKGGGANPVYTIWQNFRNVAAVMMILVFFAIIFGTALGFDNYTIKKSLPHLVAGAILMPLSFYICAVMIDIGNILGQGILTLADTFIPKPYVDFTQPLSLIFYGLGATVVGIALKGAVADIGLALLITIVIAVLATFFTLVLRQIIIYLLVVLSPFAILAWILPNTSKWFTQWWQNMLKLILMYPLIMLLFEAGRIFAVVAPTAFTAGGGSGELMQAATPILALVGLYLPLGAVPWTFSWAGGAMKMGAGAIGRVSGNANKRWGKNSQFDKDRSERRRERAAASYTGRPVTALGKRLQQKRLNTETGEMEFVNPRLAKLARGAAATRGGFGGAFPGMGPGKVAKRQMVGIAQKARQDEVVAEASEAQLKADMESNQYKGHDEIIAESVREHMASQRDAAKRALATTFKRAALTSSQLETLASGRGEVEIDGVKYSGAHDERIRETAINELAQQEQWDSIRNMWQSGQISSDTLKRGTDGTKVVGQARDMGLGVTSDIDTKAEFVRTGAASQQQIQEWDRTGWASAPAQLRDQLAQFNDTVRMGVMSTRDAGHVSSMDKSTKWDYLAQSARGDELPYRAQLVKNVDEILRNGGVGLDAASQKAIYEAVARDGATGRAEIASSRKVFNPATGKDETVKQEIFFKPDEMQQLARYFQQDPATGHRDFRINPPIQRSVQVNAQGDPINP